MLLLVSQPTFSRPNRLKIVEHARIGGVKVAPYDRNIHVADDYRQKKGKAEKVHKELRHFPVQDHGQQKADPHIAHYRHQGK